MGAEGRREVGGSDGNARNVLNIAGDQISTDSILPSEPKTESS